MRKHIILFLAANPLGTTELALGREARAIEEELERSRQRDRFEFVTRWAVQPLDLIRELRKLKPTVVHFSGHGGSGGRQPGAGPRRDIVPELGGDGGTDDGDHQGGLFFQGPDGRPQLVTAAALRETFGAAGTSVKLVVLNACYSETHAEALLVHVHCVVGTGGSLRDDAARAFAIGFYGGLGERQSVAAAHLQGCAAISLEEPPDGGRPQLRVRDGVNADQVVLADINAVDRGMLRAPSIARSPSTEAVVLHSSSSHVMAAAVGISPVRPLVSVGPIPAYPDAEVEQLSKRIEDARARRSRLRGAGMAVDHLDREILELRRQLREGGQLRAGDALGDGRYLLVKVVGRGGFAVVWEAYDRTVQQRVAIKVLHSNLAGDPLRRERFFRGAQAMMRLAHPAVVRVLEPKGEDGGFYYFVMEFVSGGNLREAVLGQRLRKADLLPLILQIGEAIAPAHARDMIHRDIKPSNILLDERGNAKLTDFDLVGAHDTTGGTRTGALGTVVYAAPECLERPQEATARADVYGLGMTAIFCLAGRDLSMDTFRNAEGTIAKLECPHPVRQVLERAVKWMPDDRFANAAAMVDALRASLNAPAEQIASMSDRQAERISSIVELSQRVELDHIHHPGAGSGSPVASLPPRTGTWPLSPRPATRPAGASRIDVDTDSFGVSDLLLWAAATGRDQYGHWAAFEVNGVRQRMRWIPPGRFMMGSPQTELGRFNDEGPQHEVTWTRGYWLGETPVTQALWVAVMGENPSRFQGYHPDDLERPVEQVSWDDCQALLDRLNARVARLAAKLPTEAEWERACRGGTMGATWAGDLSGEEDAPELDAIAWYRGNSGNETHPVGRKGAGPYGLHDMLGNVWEWCTDGAKGLGRPYPYDAVSVTDPVATGLDSYRVNRGGSWFSDARFVRAANRYANLRDSRRDYLGFRLAVDQ